MSHANRPIPLRPVFPSEASDHAASPIVRAMLCVLQSKLETGLNEKDITSVCRRLFPEDHRTLNFLKKAAVSPGSTTTATFGAELVGSIVGAFLASLAPASAIAGIIPLGISVDLASSQLVSLPFRTTNPVARPWVAENSAIAVMSSAFGQVEMGPASKIGIIAAASRELLKRSHAEAIFAQMVRDDAAISLDTAYLSTDAAATGSQEGLLYGLTPIPSQFNGSTREMIAGDLSALGSTVATDGFGSVVFIVSPARSIRLQLLAPDMRLPVLPSIAVPEDRVIAVDPVSIVHGFGTDPDVIWSQQATIHMDSEPLPIRAGGVTASPVRSLWQTNSVATRMILDVAFAKRRPGAVAFMDAVTGW